MYVMINIHSSLDNDFCVRLYAICMDPFCLITEFIPHGDLFALIHEVLLFN
jgi:hypothetical protein